MNAKSRPIVPKWKEVEEHEATHYPVRSWCRHCCAGHGRLGGHAAVSKPSVNENPTIIVCDYCCFNDVEKEESGERGAPEAPGHQEGSDKLSRRMAQIHMQ